MAIKLYVENLAKYNGGELAGEWIDLPQDSDELDETLGRIAGKTDDYEGSELAIHDFEAPFQIGEYDNIEKLNELAEVLANDYGRESENVVTAILRALDEETLEAKIEALRDREFTVLEDVSSMGDVAREMYEESGELAELEKIASPVRGVSMASYIDWEAMGRDLEINGGFDFYRDLEVCIVR